MNKQTIYLSSPAVVSALGCGLDKHIACLLNPPAQTVLTQQKMPVTGKPYYFGVVPEPLPQLPCHLSQPYNRNNHLLWVAIEQIRDYIDEVIEKYGKHRVAVIVGTSTGGIETNLPVFQTVADGGKWSDTPIEQDMQVLSSPADFLRDALGLTGLTYGISTACTSGARAIISAARLLQADLCDAVICGGADMLSTLTLNGFDSLSVLSNGIANPCSKNRNGINIGEAAALFVANKDGVGLPLLGYGVSSDAYHMSSPHPEGLGAEIAFQAALHNAQLTADEVGWINLHGTGTIHNDAMESRAVSRVFGTDTPATSTKPLTGHTLGAAGALEAAFLWGIVSREYNPDGHLPPHLFDGEQDPELPPIHLTHSGSRFAQQRRIAASSSFAFGGNNSVVIIGENIVGSQQKPTRRIAADSITNTARQANADGFCCESTMMIECPFRQPAKLLPHTGKMVLLDSVLECIDNRVVALATIQKDCILLPTDTATHLPTYLAIEIMAQTVGAWAGAVALSHGEKVRIGFLLGTRRFEMSVAEIQVGTELRCEATLSWQDDTGMGVFDCVLLNHQNEEKIATASLNLYRPNERDLQQILDNEQ